MRITIIQDDMLMCAAFQAMLEKMIGQPVISSGGGQERRVFTFESSLKGNDAQVLDALFSCFNDNAEIAPKMDPHRSLSDHYSEAGMYSMSIGHVVRIQRGRYAHTYMLKSGGWVYVS